MDRRTRAVRAGRTAKGGSTGTEPHVPLIDMSTTYRLGDPDQATRSLDEMIAGRPPSGSPVYARLHNPTVAAFEDALAELEGADGAVAFASGMAAITALLLAARTDGPHVVAIRPLYGGTDHVLSSGLLGTEVTWTVPDQISDAIRADTSLVFLETPANPTLDLVDITQVVEEACPVPVVVDSTFATPVLQNPVDHGAMVVHSATKFLGGHGDVVGGVVAGPTSWVERLRAIRVATGGLLHPLAGYLLHRGLQTLPLRVEAQQETAGILANRLAGHPLVTRVHYPGLGADPSANRIMAKQMRGPGAVLAFEVEGGTAATRDFMRALQLLTPAVSLGSVDSLIQHPAGLTHRIVEPEARARGGISDGLLRLSVGLEGIEDLWQDLERGLDRVTELRRGSAWRVSPGGSQLAEGAGV